MLWHGRFAGDGCTFTCTPCSINASLTLAHQSSSTRLQNARATRSRHRTSAQLKCGIGVRQQQHARAMRLSRLPLAETRPIIGRVEAGRRRSAFLPFSHVLGRKLHVKPARTPHHSVATGAMSTTCTRFTRHCCRTLLVTDGHDSLCPLPSPTNFM